MPARRSSPELVRWRAGALVGALAAGCEHGAALGADAVPKCAVIRGYSCWVPSSCRSFLSGRYPDKTKTWNFFNDFREVSTRILG